MTSDSCGTTRRRETEAGGGHGYTLVRPLEEPLGRSSTSGTVGEEDDAKYESG